MRYRWGLGVGIVVASLVASSCISSTGDTTTTTTSVTTTIPDDPNGGLTARERLIELEESGSSELELALAELSAYVGPLPGVPAVGLDDSLHRSFTGPLRKARSLRDQMTDEQQTAVDSALTGIADPSRVVAAYDPAGNEVIRRTEVQGLAGGVVAAGAQTIGCPPGAPRVDDDAIPLLESWRQRFDEAGEALASEFPGDVDYVVMFTDPAFGELRRGEAVAFAGGREPISGPYLDALKACFGIFDCYIVVDIMNADSDWAKLLAAHEWFHCWHYDLVETQEAWAADPYWVSEGLAEWVGERHANRGAPWQDSWWLSYFDPEEETEPGRYDLFDSSSEYSAVGFWSHVANHTDLVSLIPSLLEELVVRDDDGMLNLVASAIGQNATATIAAAPTQRPDLGSQWTTSGRGMPPGSRSEPSDVVGVGEDIRLQAAPGEQIAKDIGVFVAPESPHIVSIALENNGTLVWSDGLASTAFSGELVEETRCVGSCVCPDGTIVETSMADIAPGASFVVALSGVAAPGARFTAVAEPLDCGEPPTEPGAAGPREPGRGGTFGHPNLITFDGISYVFHGAGDYALVESTTDDLAIHARFSRLDNMTGVSYNRAVAARVGTSVVTFGDDAESTAFDPAVVRVDGVVVEPNSTPLDVAGEATLTSFDQRFVLTWADGTELRVGLRVGDQFDVLVPQERWGDVAGLLGDADGNPLHDIATRDGEPVDPHLFEEFYATFGASWLLDTSASLFESELDPADIEPIVPSAQLTLADLSPAIRAEAEAICRVGGVTPAFGLSQCIFDVAMTGDSSWIRSVLAMQEIIDNAVSVSALTETPEDVTVMDGDGVYGGELAEKFGVDVYPVGLTVGGSLRLTATECPEIPTFEVALISPAGFIVDRSRGDDCGQLNVRRVAEPGEYRIAVYDNGGFTGAYALEVGVSELGDGDQVEFGVPFDIVVGEAGVDPSVTFDADAGDRLTFSHPPDTGDNANLGFAVYSLIGPGGTVVESWPVREDSTVSILVDGTYTLLVDIIVGVEPGSVTITISNDSSGAPARVQIGESFTMEVAEPGDIPLVTFEAAAGDRLLIESDVPDIYFYAAATFRLLDPEAGELAWWFGFRDGDVEIPADGVYTLSFEPGNSDETAMFNVLINRQ